MYRLSSSALGRSCPGGRGHFLALAPTPTTRASLGVVVTAPPKPVPIPTCPQSAKTTSDKRDDVSRVAAVYCRALESLTELQNRSSGRGYNGIVTRQNRLQFGAREVHRVSSVPYLYLFLRRSL